MNDYEFKKWDPYKYLNDYFNDFPDFEDTIKFIIKSLKGRSYDSAIDIGCGPTSCYWSAVSNFCKFIDIADFKKSNLKAVNDWVCDKNKFDWSHYSKLALKYLNKSVTSKSVSIYETKAKMKLGKRYICNVFKQPVVKNNKQYDLVSTFYCADSISKNKKEWHIAMDNICSMLSPNGTIIGAAMEKCKFYCVDNVKYPCANLTQLDIKNFLVAKKFTNINIQIGKEFYRGKELKENHNYSNLIFFQANR